jgi:hypothetical protein
MSDRCWAACITSIRSPPHRPDRIFAAYNYRLALSSRRLARELLRTRDPGGDISRMAVHDFGAIAIASFTQDAVGGSVFVVDVWLGQGTDWKLAVRYPVPRDHPHSRSRVGAPANRKSPRSISTPQ